MSHILDIDGITEKLVLLEHLVTGSENYCKKRLVGSEYDQGEKEYEYYWGWVKSIVCNYTIECAIKFRILQDTLRGEHDIVKFDELDAKSCNGLFIGKIIAGSFQLSLRETCNKIIHARHVLPQWVTSQYNDTDFKYWNGTITLRGTQNSAQWELLLDMGVWPQAMQLFINEFSTTDASFYVGQDWY